MSGRRGPIALALTLASLASLAPAALGVAAPAAATPAAEAPPAAAPLAGSSTGVGTERIRHGRLENIVLYAPAHAPVKSVVLLLSGERGFDATGAALAAALAEHGALVAGIALPELEKSFAADGADCVFPDGDLENLGHFIEAYRHLPRYLPPRLVGYGAGATLAYATLVQAPAHVFAGALTVGFCAESSWRPQLCRGAGLELVPHRSGLTVRPALHLRDPLVSIEGGRDACASPAFFASMQGAARVALPDVRLAGEQLEPASLPVVLPPFLAAYDRLSAADAAAASVPAPAAEALGDLPLIEVPAAGAGSAGDVFAILVSGDGGWAGLDKEVAQALAADGVPTIGLDSLRYFWSARTPAGLAADLDRIVRHEATALGRPRVMLIGYSQGANVLPFAINRLPAATRARIALTALLGLSDHALFEFHLSSWVADDRSGPATVPEVERLTGNSPVLCIYGSDESDSPCPRLDPRRIKIVKLDGGHHFNGNYADLARQIIGALTP